MSHDPADADTNSCPAKASNSRCSRTRASRLKTLAYIAWRQAKIHPYAGWQMGHPRKASRTVRNVAAFTPATIRNRSPVLKYQLQEPHTPSTPAVPRCSIHQRETYRRFFLQRLRHTYRRSILSSLRFNLV